MLAEIKCHASLVEAFLQLLYMINIYLMIPKEFVNEFCLTLKYLLTSLICRKGLVHIVFRCVCRYVFFNYTHVTSINDYLLTNLLSYLYTVFNGRK